MCMQGEALPLVLQQLLLQSQQQQQPAGEPNAAQDAPWQLQLARELWAQVSLAFALTACMQSQGFTGDSTCRLCRSSLLRGRGRR